MTDDDEEILTKDSLDADDTEEKDDDLFGDNFDLGYDGYGDVSQAPMEKHSELLKELTDFDKGLKEQVDSWLGRIWDEGRKEYVEDPKTEPIMNEKGAKWCISYIKNYAKKPNIITHILLKDYNYICHDIIEICWEEFATKCEDYGVKNNNDLKRICVELEHTARLVLMGAGDGKYNKLLKESTQRTENVSFTNPVAMQNYTNPQMPRRKLSPLQKLKNKFIGG